MASNQYPLFDSLEVRTAEVLGIELDLVEKIIKHKWKYIYDNFANANTIEDSGFGKFKVRQHRLKRVMAKLEKAAANNRLRLEDPNTKEEMINHIKGSLESAEHSIEYLKKKLQDEDGD